MLLRVQLYRSLLRGAMDAQIIYLVQPLLQLTLHILLVPELAAI